MLLPKGGINWKAARATLPPTRAIWAFLTKTRFLLLVAVTGAVILLWRGISTSASEMQKLEPPFLDSRALELTLVFPNLDSTVGVRQHPQWR